MIHVTQDEFGEHGNCMSACLASIFEIRLDQVPNFTRLNEPRGAWFKHFWNFCRERGFEPYFHYGAWEDRQDFMKQPGGGHCFYLQCGPAARGFDHATVGWNGSVLWDPHPSRAGLIETKDYIFLKRIDRNARPGGDLPPEVPNEKAHQDQAR